MRKLFAALIVLCIALILMAFHYNGYRRTWRQFWNLQTYSSPFLDMRVITGSAESLAAGYDPRIDNYYDPIHREFNYPLIWYPLLESGINSRWVIPLSIAAILLFFIGLVLFPGKLTYPSVFLLLLIAFSYVVMLGVERANIDLLFFFLVSMTLVFLEISIFVSFGFLALGILFKIFPVFAIGLFLNPAQKNSIKYVLAVAAFAILYFMIMFQDMLTIFRLTPKDEYGSYGVGILPIHLSKLLPGSYSVLSVIFYSIAVVIILVAFYLAFRNRNIYSSTNLRNLRAFWAGAGIYIGTFLLGNSYDYRLMFLLFTIPQLAEWAFQPKYNAWAARISLLTMVLSCWYGVISGVWTNDHGVLYYFTQLMNWALLAGMLYLFFVSLPPWLFRFVGWKETALSSGD